jgi:hypothetical protein
MYGGGTSYMVEAHHVGWRHIMYGEGAPWSVKAGLRRRIRPNEHPCCTSRGQCMVAMCVWPRLIMMAAIATQIWGWG